jgi:hypothetical protein
MKTKTYYFAVNLDREIFKDEKGNEYTTEEVKDIVNKSIFRDIKDKVRIDVNMTMMAARLINEFNFDFAATRKFYNSI